MRKTKPTRETHDALLGALYDSPKGAPTPSPQAAPPGDITRYEPPDTYVDPIAHAEQRMQQHSNSQMGLPEEFLEGWNRQLECGWDSPDTLTRADLNGAIWTKETGLVTEGMRREAEYRAEQDRQREMEDSFDPYKARLRRQGVL